MGLYALLFDRIQGSMWYVCGAHFAGACRLGQRWHSFPARRASAL